MTIVTTIRLLMLGMLVAVIVTSLAIAHAESPEAFEGEADRLDIVEESVRFSYFDGMPQLEWDEIPNANGFIVQIGDDESVTMNEPTSCMRFTNVPQDAKVRLIVTTNDGNDITIYNDVLPNY